MPVKVGIVLDEFPRECHECPFQLRFKDGIQDNWYVRRCIIEQRQIEYPRPKWCPLEIISVLKNKENER